MDVEDQEKIFSEIFTECDINNTNNVQVSALLSYIGPYIDSNSHHFDELKNSLDPTDVNPFIDKDTFLNAMLNWSEKFKNEVDFNFNNEEISRQSTPTKNLRIEYDGLNLSSISAYSLSGSVLSTIDPNLLQDQNNELQHQNKKLTECLDDVKYQLTGLEEQNVSLQNEIERINKNCQSDQKLIKTLQLKCAEFEKEREEHTKIINEYKINNENFVSIKRIKVELENRIKELEEKNKAHAEAIEMLSDLSNEKEELNEKLRKEIEERDAEISRIQERETEWRQKCAQSELNIKNFVAEINDLKNHIQSLEASTQNRGVHQISLKMDNFEPDLQDSPTPGKCRSVSLSPEEEDICEKMQLQERTSPHESLQSELSHISTSDCFNSCEYRINQLDDEIVKLYEQLRETNEEMDRAKSVKGAVEEELASARKETKAFHEKCNSLSSELEAALRDKQQSTVECKQLKSKLAYYKVINKNFKAQLDGKLSEVIVLRKKLKEKEAKEVLGIRGAQETLDKLKETIELREGENKELVGKVAAMEAEVRELKETNCKLMNEMCSLERAAKLERMRNARVDLNARIRELEEQVEQTRAKNQHLMSSVSALTGDKQQLISKLELLENNEYGKRKVEKLESRLHKYRRQVTDLENHVLCKTNDTDTHMEHVKLVVHASKEALKTTTFYTWDVWKDLFKRLTPDLDISNLLNVVLFHGDGDAVKIQDGPLQDEINLLNNQIHVTALLLKAFVKIKNKVTINEEDENEKERGDGKENSKKIDVKQLYNPHESNNESFLSKLTPKRFFLKPPTLVLKSKSKTHFVFPPAPSPSRMTPECPQSPEQMSLSAQQQTLLLLNTSKNHVELNNNNMSANIEKEKEKEGSTNSTFTKTYNDSLIEKILTEQKIDDPVARIEDTQILNSENSDCESGSSSSSKDNDEDAERKSRKERKIKEEEEVIKERLARQVRSMSEGAAVVHQLTKDGDVMVFPNLQDSALDALGLMANEQPKERLTEEEIELKFQTLSLAFSIDAVTIKDRLERQQRQRDQAEDNLSTEISRFINAVHKLHPLCVDAETTELLTSLLNRLQIIVQASHRISTSAEIFGSVQQEWRIADSVNLMLSHLRNLIKQRDAARRQLQITKRMLQETTTASILKKAPGGSVPTTRRLTINTLPTGTGAAMVNGRLVTPARRASIAVIPRALESPSAAMSATSTAAVAPVVRRVAVRRTSEAASGERAEPLSRPWDSRRVQEWTHDRKTPLLSRPSRLEINPELSKIQEGSTESFIGSADADADEQVVESSGDESMGFATPCGATTGSGLFLEYPLLAESKKVMVERVRHHLRRMARWAACELERWAENGTLHEVCFIGATVCFALATILLCNTIMEVELARDGVRHHVPWKYLTWDEFFSLFYRKQ